MNTIRNYENSRTDLAIERLDFAAETLPEGVFRKDVQKGSTKITRVEIKESSAAEILGKEHNLQALRQMLLDEQRLKQNKTGNGIGFRVN